MKRLLLALIRYYQRAVSPGLPAACRYQPTCSRYAYEAIDRFGPARGSWLAFRRLMRCFPWNAGGYDPVPAKNGLEAMQTDSSAVGRPAPFASATGAVKDRRQV